MQSSGSVIAVIKQLLNANAWSCWNISLPYSYTLPYSFHIKNIADLWYVWIPLWPDYWSRSAKHQLINCIHVQEVIQSLLSISEKSLGKPSSLRILPREIFAYMSITIHYDRSNYNLIWKSRTKDILHVSTFNLFKISPVQSQPITTKYFA